MPLYSEQKRNRSRSFNNLSLQQNLNDAAEITTDVTEISDLNIDNEQLLTSTISNSYNFYSPIIHAQGEMSQSTLLDCHTITRFFLQASLSAAAAYFVANPSIKYSSNSNYFDKITFPASTILTGFLINVFAANYLWFEFAHARGARRIIILSFLMGFLTALPNFFVQLMESKELGIAITIVTSLLVTIGSTPLQTVGFFDFITNIGFRMRYLYYKYLSCGKNKDQIIREYLTSQRFMNLLEDNMDYLVMTDAIPPNYLTSTPQDLLLIIFSLPERQSVFKKLIFIRDLVGIVAGIAGILVAESMNVSFGKAMYIELETKITPVGAGIVTSACMFPLLFLSAQYGFSAVRKIFETTFDLSLQIANSIRRGTFQINLTPPTGIHKKAATITALLSLFITSRSYAGLVQFNLDAFPDLDQEYLNALNQFTKVGGVIFNVYLVWDIGRGVLSSALQRYGNEKVQQNAKFNRLGEYILKGYKHMPRGLMFSALKNNPAFLSAEVNTPNPEQQSSLLAPTFG